MLGEAYRGRSIQPSEDMATGERKARAWARAELLYRFKCRIARVSCCRYVRYDHNQLYIQTQLGNTNTVYAFT